MRALSVLIAISLATPCLAASFRISGSDDARPAEAPYALTASDGTGLRLVALDAEAVLTGPLAFTEMRFTFENPNDRVIEGRFRITLPEGAAVSRFAMKTAGGWQEGEVIEKQRARRVYEDFLHRRQDPALLEQAAGNEFRARVFPIPARGQKEIILSYSHQLDKPSAPYALPLRGLAEVGTLTARAHGDAKGELSRKRWVPDRDFVVQRDVALAGIAHASGFLTPVVAVEEGARDPVRSLLLLVDTSASQALGFDRRARRVARLIDGLAAGTGASTPVRVAAFDQGVKLLYDGPASGFSDKGLRALRRRRALGASDLGKALAWAADHAAGMDRFVIMTDGVPTFGKTAAGELAPALRRLEATKLQRVDAIVTGGVRDTELLRRVLDLDLPRAGAVIDGDGALADVAEALERRTLREVQVQVPGAAWVWPSTLRGVQAGEVRWVFASSAKRSVKVAGRSVKVRYREVSGPLVERQLRAAQIRNLVAARDLATSKEARAKLKDEIVKLSEEHRVLSPFTALLVLETAEDYKRYGIDRRALADILVVERGKVVARSRGNIVVPKRPKPVKKPPVKAKPKKMSRAREGEAEKEMDLADEDDDFGDEGEADPGPPAAKPVADPQPDMEVEESADEAKSVMAEPSEAPPPPPAAMRESRPAPADRRRRDDSNDKIEAANPWSGKYKEIRGLISRGKKQQALAMARGWREEDPKAVLALVALGDAHAALGQREEAARAYASIVDLFSSRADLRRFAGNLLESLKGGEEIAVDVYAKAREQRPDHPASHRLLAFALIKSGRADEAFVVLEEGLKRSYPGGRFAGADQILREDLGLAAAAWKASSPRERKAIDARLKKAGGRLESKPSLRFVLTWETDANDVDFHIYDGRGGHAYYSQPTLPSGGNLYADVTTGYGPECFTIRKPRRKRATPYRLRAHYYSRGPMGYGMGKLQVIDHDGKGKLRFEEHPYVVMNDSAYVELGRVK
jgi:tetratricopeptide (TPR) repeat protein